MSINTNWSIDQYRNKFEPMDHWNLKKEFMEKHKSLIEEDRLVCLAQVFVNMEILGCKYPVAVMKQVKELSKGIGDNYKSKRQKSLKRTFVCADDAAMSKVNKAKRAKFQIGAT